MTDLILFILAEAVNLFFLGCLFLFYRECRHQGNSGVFTDGGKYDAAVFIGILLFVKGLWFFALSSAFAVPLSTLFTFSFKRFLYLIISDISAGVFTLFFSASPEDSGTKPPTVLFCAIQLVIAAIAVLSIHAIGRSSENSTVLWIDLFLILLLSVLTVSFYRYTTVLFHRELSERERLHRQEETEKRMQEVTDIYHSLHMLRHDLKRHLMTAEQMLDREEGKRYLQGVEDRLFTLFSTGCLPLDAYLTVESMQLQQKGIRFDHELCSLQDLPVHDVSLCSIIGNLLDNAAEAVERTEDPGNAYISLKMRILRDMLFITCTNPYNEQTVHFKNGLFISDKKGPDHGQGLKIISKLAKELGGTFTADAKDQIFTATVMLPTGLRSDPTSVQYR